MGCRNCKFSINGLSSSYCRWKTGFEGNSGAVSGLPAVNTVLLGTFVPFSFGLVQPQGSPLLPFVLITLMLEAFGKLILHCCSGLENPGLVQLSATVRRNPSSNPSTGLGPCGYAGTVGPLGPTGLSCSHGTSCSSTFFISKEGAVSVDLRTVTPALP